MRRRACLPRVKRVWLLRGLLALTLCAAAAAFLLWPGALAGATSGAGTFGRKELLLSIVTLGVLGLAAYGFDLREWL